MPEKQPSLAAILLYAASFPIIVVLFVLPAYWSVKKLGQTLLGHSPRDDLRDAVPVRFEGPRDPCPEERPIQFSLKTAFAGVTLIAFLSGAYPYLPLVEPIEPFVVEFVSLSLYIGVPALATIAVSIRCARFLRGLSGRRDP